MPSRQRDYHSVIACLTNGRRTLSLVALTFSMTQEKRLQCFISVDLLHL
jgi:hypothetical protein